MQHSKRLKIFLALLPLSILSLSAQSAFDSAAETILSRNSSVDALEMAGRSEIALMRSENTLENPEIEFSHRWGSKGAGNKWDLGITQSIEWPGVYSARSSAASLTERAMQFQAKSRRQELMTEIRLALVDYISALKKIELDRTLLARFDSVVYYSKKAYDGGEMPIYVYNRCRLELLELKRQLNQAQDELQSAKGNLAAFCDAGISQEELDGIMGKLTDFPLAYSALLPMERYLELAATNNGAIMYNEAMAKSSQGDERAARLARLPGFSLGYVHEYEGGERFNGFKAGVSIPLFSGKYKEEAAREARKGYDLASSSILATEEARIRSEYARAKRLNAEMAEYTEILNSDTSPALLYRSLMAGEITMMDYLRELNYFVDARRTLLEISSEYYALAVQLSRFNY